MADNKSVKEQDHSSQTLGRQQALQVAAGGGVTEDLRPLVWPRLARETTFDLKPERESALKAYSRQMAVGAMAGNAWHTALSAKARRCSPAPPP